MVFNIVHLPPGLILSDEFVFSSNAHENLRSLENGFGNSQDLSVSLLDYIMLIQLQKFRNPKFQEP